MKRAVFVLATLLATYCPANNTSPSPSQTTLTTDAPAGEYRLDRTHADLSFRVSHLGFSMYTARFTEFDATLHFNPTSPATMSVSATIEVDSLALPAPPEGFTQELLGAKWLDAARFPRITFRSTAVQLTGANSVRVDGDLTLHGMTKPVTLNATFNGGYAGHPYDPNARIGFSARGSIKRSDFGVALGIPPAGSTMGVGDEVEIVIEAEFSGPRRAAG